MANQRTVLPRALVRGALIALALATSHCDNAQCETLRDDLTREKLGWQDCARDTDCIKIGGNNADCTGVLSCDLAVHVSHRLAAERRVASLPEETQDCLQCASPNCVTGDIALCEPVSKKCILVTEILPSGVLSSASEPPSTPTAGAPSTVQ